MTLTRAVSLALAFLVIASGAFVFASVAAGQETTQSCRTSVTHDAFRTDSDVIDAVANGTRGVSTEQNTRTTLVEDGSFYRLTANNPNSYCVAFRVEVSAEAMEPAQIPGNVDSNSGNVTASWDARHDFDDGSTTTVIEFVLPSSSTAEFAPNRIRVIGLSWASQKPTEADSVWDELKPDFLRDTVEKRHYRITTAEENTPRTVAVPLEHPETGETIEEYHAQYSTDGGETWRPVPRSTDEAVYLREVDDGNEIHLTFNDAAEVRLTVNPTTVDDAKREVESYKAGIAKMLGGFDFFGDEDS